jgi:hypothetical protein
MNRSAFAALFASVCLLVPLAETAISAADSPFLTPSECAGIWGGQSGCMAKANLIACQNTSSCTGHQSTEQGCLNGNCTGMCSGSGNTGQCAAGDLLRVCNSQLIGNGCGKTAQVGYAGSCTGTEDGDGDWICSCSQAAYSNQPCQQNRITGTDCDGNPYP